MNTSNPLQVRHAADLEASHARRLCCHCRCELCLTRRQVTLAVMISGWAHVLHAVFKPWGTASITYKLQHLSLFTTTFVFLLGLLFKANGVDAKDTSFG